jgi:hypothetical protein
VLGRGFGAVATFGIVLGAIYLLYATGRVLFGPLREPAGTPDLSTLPRDLNAREIAILTPLALAAVLLGVAPRLITDTLDPALQVQILDRARRGATAVIPTQCSERGIWPRMENALALSPAAPAAGPDDRGGLTCPSLARRARLRALAGAGTARGSEPFTGRSQIPRRSPPRPPRNDSARAPLASRGFAEGPACR